MFEVGEVYNRRADIHGPYGGQQPGGISTPSAWPFVFLFTGESGEQYGYRDGWDENGVFLYTGEGQVGDMAFVRGNQAIRNHAATVRVARDYDSDIDVDYGGREADAKRVLEYLMVLGKARRGEQVLVRAEGEDAGEAIEAYAKLVEGE